MLEQRGPDGFTVDEVLVESVTSSSSLYHHFGSREGLLEAARDESYRRLARSEDRRNLEGGFRATTTEEFLDYVAEQVERIVTESGSVDTRAWLSVAIPAALAPLRPPAQP